jgi:predicted adenine nucleotide alpha hydrolase (AANH) superfamily ATPase
MDVLIHICCGVCILEPLRELRGEGHEVLGVWVNPNIEPAAEHDRRLDALGTVVRVEGFSLVRLDAPEYAPPAAEPSDERCGYCYRTRLLPTARLAAESGAAFTTTLLFSRYQRHELIKSVAEGLAAETGARFLYRDWRPLFNRGQSRARRLGIYRQRYCGCLPSLDARLKE